MIFPLAFFSMGPMEMAVVGIIAILLFGKRLPEVARSLGKGVTEFKKGIRGVEDEIMAEQEPHSELPRSTEVQPPKAPKFEPPENPPDEPADQLETDEPETSQVKSAADVDAERNESAD